MTRSEFLECITDFWDLKVFCDENGINICDDVIDRDSFDEIIIDRIRDRGCFVDWREVYRFLHDLPDGAAYYIENGYGEFEEAFDNDFDDYKQQVLEYMDDQDEWDPEDGEEDVEEEIADDDCILTYRPAEEPADMEITEEEFYMVIGRAG